MTNYNILRLMTVKEYDGLKAVRTLIGYDFEDGDIGELYLNKLLVKEVLSISHDDITKYLEGLETHYRAFHDDYITGIEVDEDPTGLMPIKERSWIVFGKKAE
jgi:hypothetical protein